jgi:hypothetical protein
MFIVLFFMMFTFANVKGDSNVHSDDALFKEFKKMYPEIKMYHQTMIENMTSHFDILMRKIYAITDLTEIASISNKVLTSEDIYYRKKILNMFEDELEHNFDELELLLKKTTSLVLSDETKQIQEKFKNNIDQLEWRLFSYMHEYEAAYKKIRHIQINTIFENNTNKSMRYLFYLDEMQNFFVLGIMMGAIIAICVKNVLDTYK